MFTYRYLSGCDANYSCSVEIQLKNFVSNLSVLFYHFFLNISKQSILQNSLYTGFASDWLPENFGLLFLRRKTKCFL